MTEFESDLVPESDVRKIPYGAPDQLDEWFDANVVSEDEDPFFDPDGPHEELHETFWFHEQYLDMTSHNPPF